MLELWRVVSAAVVLFCSLLPIETRAATFDVIGTLNLDGQTLALGPTATLNFEIAGPISNPINLGYLLSVSMTGAPSTTATTTNIVPFIGATANANVNGATATVDTNNCSAGCGLTQPKFGNAFTISDTQRLLSISLGASYLISGAPTNDVITIDYNLILGLLPQGLSAELVTPLPESIWLFATGFGLFASGAWLQKRKQRAVALAV